KELRAPDPAADRTVTIDRRADVMQIGVVGLSLLLGRLLSDEEFPAGLSDMIEGLNAVSSKGLAALPGEMKSWLRRALQLETGRSFGTAVEARIEFEKTIKANDAHA